MDRNASITSQVRTSLSVLKRLSCNHHLYKQHKNNTNHSSLITAQNDMISIVHGRKRLETLIRVLQSENGEFQERIIMGPLLTVSCTFNKGRKKQLYTVQDKLNVAIFCHCLWWSFRLFYNLQVSYHKWNIFLWNDSYFSYQTLPTLYRFIEFLYLAGDLKASAVNCGNFQTFTCQTWKNLIE